MQTWVRAIREITSLNKKLTTYSLLGCTGNPVPQRGGTVTTLFKVEGRNGGTMPTLGKPP